jgi:hypothetical protein
MNTHLFHALLVAIAFLVVFQGDSGPSAATPQAPTHRFVVVSGAGYEGAIIPAELMRLWWDGRPQPGFWTPTSKDVERLEAVVQKYLRDALRDPRAVTPPINSLGTLSPPSSAEELQQLVDGLAKYRRQYYGAMDGERRRIEVHAFLPTGLADWRNEFILTYDRGCADWYVSFDAGSQRIIQFNCASNGG